MKILLSDLDVIEQRRPFPNLALMKLSAYHKAKGDEVWLNFPLCLPDKEYASCVFSWNRNGTSRLQNGAIVGGSGINLKAELLPEIEHTMPDYTLYPKITFSLGFTSRGCIRRCPWCIVPEKEGQSRPWCRIYEFWDRRHSKIVLLDNNILATSNWRMTMDDLIAEGLEVDFNQGLDIRLVNEENVGYLKRLKTKKLRFAFDNIAYKPAVLEGTRLLFENGIPPRKLSFYVLVGFRNDENVLERMMLLNSLGVDVYPMIYKGKDGKEPEISKGTLREIRDNLGEKDVFWHGNPQNLRKFLRVVGRLGGGY